MPRVAAVVVLVVSLLAGCGSATGTAEQLDQAVRDYSAAFLSGQGEKAAGMLSARCNTPALHARIVQLAQMAAALYGQAKIISVEPVVNGKHGAVTYRFDQPAIDQQNQPWTWEDGTWRYDQC